MSNELTTFQELRKEGRKQAIQEFFKDDPVKMQEMLDLEDLK